MQNVFYDLFASSWVVGFDVCAPISSHEFARGRSFRKSVTMTAAMAKKRMAVKPCACPSNEHSRYLPHYLLFTLLTRNIPFIDPTRWQPAAACEWHCSEVSHATHWGTITPFALTSGSQFRPGGPVRDATSSAYKSQADQILQYSAQLNDQTKTIADYWANGPHTETPPGHWDLFAQFYIGQFLSLKYHHDLNMAVNGCPSRSRRS